MNSNISQFYKKSQSERYHLLEAAGVSESLINRLQQPVQLDEDVANSLIENQISQYALPMGVALNFIIDDCDTLIPMVTEEPSVIAACSHAAKMARPLGGFHTIHQSRQMTGQIVLQDIKEPFKAISKLQTHTHEWIQIANEIHPSIVKRGGGVQQIIVRPISNHNGQIEFITLNIIVDTKDAMGANIMNTILEGLAPLITECVGGHALLRILSNYSDMTVVTSSCDIPFSSLSSNIEEGKQIAENIAKATYYASLDPFRATTHNKGIMNGVDAVVLATGNDTRAISAGAHAFASRYGQYQPLTHWNVQKNHLHGEITLPLPVGTVGGAIKVLPRASEALELMNVTSASHLARIIAAIGLAQNLAALKALVNEGIQKGHMSLHAKSLAIHAGAKGQEIEQVAEQLRQSKKMDAKTAQQILFKIRH